MKLTILYLHNGKLVSLLMAVDALLKANLFLREADKPEAFQLKLVGLDPNPTLPDILADLEYEQLSDSIQKAGIIFIPSLNEVDIENAVKSNSNFFKWISDSYHSGAKLASLCTGVFMLAEAGVLKGINATSHVEACNLLSTNYEGIKVLREAVVTKDKNIYTSGGALSSINLIIMLVQEFCGREVAVRLAKNLEVDMHKSTQLHYSAFAPILSENDILVQKVQLFIEREFGNLKNVEEALKVVPSSRRNIIRRFKTATGLTPIKYLQKTKIEAAKLLLETTDKDIVDIMLNSGYSDSKSFRELFKTITGLTPKEYRDTYGMGFVKT